MAKIEHLKAAATTSTCPLIGSPEALELPAQWRRLSSQPSLAAEMNSMPRRLTQTTHDPPIHDYASPDRTLAGTSDDPPCSPSLLAGPWPRSSPAHHKATPQSQSAFQSPAPHPPSAGPFLNPFDFTDYGLVPTNPRQDPNMQLMPGFVCTADYSYEHGLFDVATQYVPLATPDPHAVVFPPTVAWSNSAHAGPDDAAAFLDPPFEPTLDSYVTGQRPWTPSDSMSPAQVRSATSSLSCGPFMDFSRQHSMAYLSPLSLINPFETAALNSGSEAGPTSVQAVMEKPRSTNSAAAAVELVRKGRKATYPEPPKAKRRATTTTTTTEASSSYSTPSPTVQRKSLGPFAHHSKTSAAAVLKSPAPKGTRETPAALLETGQRPPEKNPQRQRNRLAATKCRAKTKLAVAGLEATERALHAEHVELSRTVMDLRDEVLSLKNQLLLHANCNSEVIQQYLLNSARDIGANALPAPPLPRNHRRGSLP